jgi:hypothetical protein
MERTASSSLVVYPAAAEPVRAGYALLCGGEENALAGLRKADYRSSRWCCGWLKLLRLKREHGAEYPRGTKSVAAHATVCGEVFCICHWPPGWEGAKKPVTREVRRPAVE